MSIKVARDRGAIPVPDQEQFPNLILERARTHKWKWHNNEPLKLLLSCQTIRPALPINPEQECILAQSDRKCKACRSS